MKQDLKRSTPICLFYENITSSAEPFISAPESAKTLLVFYFYLLKFLKEILKELFYDLRMEKLTVLLLSYITNPILVIFENLTI